jgi:hypothetical protein
LPLASTARRNRTLNCFGVRASQPLSVWQHTGWIYHEDPRCWFSRKNTALRRLGWLLAFWLGCVASLGLVAWGLKLMMRAAGMSGSASHLPCLD